MCLDSLNKFKTNGYGYKVIEEKSLSDARKKVYIKHSLFKGSGYILYKKYRWNIDKSKQTIIITEPYELKEIGKYRTGFHLFVKKIDAEKWIKNYLLKLLIKKVQYKDVVATGYQDGFKIVVVRKFKFVSEKGDQND